MKRATLVLVLLATTSLRAQEPAPADVKAPLPVFAKCEKGDWEALLLRIRPSGEMTRISKHVLLFTVAEVRPDSVTLMVGSLPENRPVQLTFKRNEPPVVGTLLTIKAERVSGVTTADETKQVGGRTFDCKKLSFTSQHTVLKGTPDRVLTSNWSIWFSSEVKGPGIVAIENADEATGGGGVWRDEDGQGSSELIGFGQGKGVTWGAEASHVALDAEVVAPTRTPLPIDPYAEPKVGDWESCLNTVTSTDPSYGGKKFVTTVRVTEVTSRTLTCELETRGAGGTKTDTLNRPRGMKLTLEDYGGLGVGELREVNVEDARLELGGATFPCKKVTYVTRKMWEAQTKLKEHYGAKTTHTLWLSTVVPGRGLVVMESAIHLTGSATGKAIDTKFRSEVVGFGREGKLDWGKRAADVDISGK
jgi:hypothetical protein